MLRPLRQASRGTIGRWKTWKADVPAGEVLIIQTGVGIERAAEAAAAVAESGRFDLFLSAGCAGALGEALRPGDLVIASEIIGDGSRFETDAAFDAHAAQICRQRNLPVHSGAVLTSPTVLATVAARRDAVQTSGAIAVEMEAAAIAEIAAEYQVPVAEVRAVLDSAEVELHESGDFMDPQSGRLRPFEVLRFVATRPGAASHLLALRRMMVAAERALDRFFAGYLV